MAKIFTTSGTGASQTLNEADSNKLKVYDDYASIDTTDLVDGEIVSTKETAADGSNVYDYINGMLTKENLLSEWEDITIPTSAETAMTMQYDGFISVRGATGSGNSVLYINDVDFLNNSYDSDSNDIPYPVKKGDVIYGSNLASSKSMAAFYKQRYYGGR